MNLLSVFYQTIHYVVYVEEVFLDVYHDQQHPYSYIVRTVINFLGVNYVPVGEKHQPIGPQLKPRLKVSYH